MQDKTIANFNILYNKIAAAPVPPVKKKIGRKIGGKMAPLAMLVGAGVIGANQAFKVNDHLKGNNTYMSPTGIQYY